MLLSNRKLVAHGGYLERKITDLAPTDQKKLLLWIWTDTSIALYLAMLKGWCHEIIRFWFSSNRK
jgi:hypothetical protein